VGIERIAGDRIEIVDARRVQSRLQRAAELALGIERQHIAARAAAGQLAIGIDQDIQHVVAPGNDAAIDQHITAGAATTAAVAHGDRNEPQLVAGGGAIGVAEDIFTVSTERHECATEQFTARGQSGARVAVHRGGRRGIRHRDQPAAVPLRDRIGGQP